MRRRVGPRSFGVPWRRVWTRYCDDEQAAYTIVDNVFVDVDVGVLIGGGRQHTVANNSFVSCGTACIHIDNVCRRPRARLRPSYRTR